MMSLACDEIGVTPEMVDAGIDVLAGYNPEFDLENEVVARIFRAMVKAMPGWPNAYLRAIYEHRRTLATP